MNNEFNLDGDDLDLGAVGDDIIIDFSDVKEDLVPAGKYLAEMVACKAGKSKAGAAKLDVRWKILTGDYANRQILDNMSLHPNRLVQIKQQLLAMGFDVSGQLRINPTEMIGRTATIVVDIEKSKNDDPETGEKYPDRNRIKGIRKAATQSVDSVLQ